MFNILVIVALSAAVASKNGGSLAIDYRPVARDVSFYTASILLLGTMFADSLVTWWESLILVLLYVLYVIFMVYNSRILGKCKAPAGARDQIVPIEDHIDSLEKAEAEIPTAGLIASEARRLSLQAPTQDPVVPLQQGQLSLRAQRRCSRATRQSLLAKRRSSMEGNPAQDVLDHAHAAAAAHSAENNQEVHKDIPSVDPEEAAVVPEAPKNDKAHSSDAYLASLPEKEANVEKLSEDENEGSPMLKFPDGNLDRLMFLFSLPFFIAFGLTVPNCGNSKYERYYAVTFAMSIAWIGLLSHFMVDFATKIACILSISPIIMGELVLAVGTSLPDAIGSMIAARNGEADMAIANAVGSNVFDIGAYPFCHARTSSVTDHLNDICYC
jgi:Ca2+/Na+ antiporter